MIFRNTQSAKLFPRAGIPEAKRWSHGSQELAIGRESYALYRFGFSFPQWDTCRIPRDCLRRGMVFITVQRSPGDRIPQAQRAVLTSSSQHAPFRREGNGE